MNTPHQNSRSQLPQKELASHVHSCQPFKRLECNEICYTYIRKNLHADMNKTETNTVYATPYYHVPQVKISQYMNTCHIFLSECLWYVSLDLSTGGPGPGYVSFPLQHGCSQQRMKLCLATKCLARK